MKVGDKLLCKSDKIHYTIIRCSFVDVVYDNIYFFVSDSIYEKLEIFDIFGYYHATEFGVYDSNLWKLFYTNIELRKLKLEKLNNN